MAKGLELWIVEQSHIRVQDNSWPLANFQPFL